MRPFPGPGGQWQISPAGGAKPHWSNDGREIVYMNLDGELTSVAVDARNGFQVAAPHRLFRIGTKMAWAAAGDHSRFLVAVRGRDAVDPPLKVVTGWLPSAMARETLTDALLGAKIERREVQRIVATGYGRINVPFADRHFTELTCHARGVSSIFPGVRLAIDIGGQD